MNAELIERFEKAIQGRSGGILSNLCRGISRDQILTRLREAAIQGKIDPLLRVFAWRNGVKAGYFAPLQGLSLFPESVYVLLDLDSAIEHFKILGESVKVHPKHLEIKGRYFPLFWDNSTSYLALDLRSASGAMVLLDPESEQLVNEFYESFEEFVEDAIHANELNEPLSCFESRYGSP